MLIRLTGISHPELDADKDCWLFVDPRHVLLIERGVASHARMSQVQKQREAMQSLHEEVDRLVAEANTLPKTATPENQEQAQQTDRWMWAREAAVALQTAYHLIARAQSETAYYPPIPCTVVSLGCGTALEHGVMLCRVNVREGPEEVASLVNNAVLPVL